MLYAAEHHISHAASAFFPSPYQKAVIITVDGVGEYATTTIGWGERNHIKILQEINNLPRSSSSILCIHILRLTRDSNEKFNKSLLSAPAYDKKECTYVSSV